MNKKSLTEIAFDLLKKKTKPKKFFDLWSEVSQVAGMEPAEAMKKMSSFYTQLILDGRFVTLGENEWDLRTRHTFDKVHIDMNDIYAEEDEDIIDDIDDVEDVADGEVVEELEVVEEDEEPKVVEFEPEESEY